MSSSDGVAYKLLLWFREMMVLLIEYRILFAVPHATKTERKLLCGMGTSFAILHDFATIWPHVWTCLTCYLTEYDLIGLSCAVKPWHVINSFCAFHWRNPRRRIRWNRLAVATLSSLQPNEQNPSCSICSCPCASELVPGAKVNEIIHSSHKFYFTAIHCFSVSLDAPRVRQTDISFALTVVLHALNPPQTRVASTKHSSGSGGGAAGDGSRGSLSVNSGCGDTRPIGASQQSHNRNQRSTLLQVAFLGMKVLMTCFSQQLTLDWPRVARCIREIGERRDGGGPFWNFLIFVATQRGPLYPFILPLMWNKVHLLLIYTLKLYI